MENTITYVGMDTHKKQHKVALHYPDQEEIIEFTVKNTVRHGIGSRILTCMMHARLLL